MQYHRNRQNADAEGKQDKKSTTSPGARHNHGDNARQGQNSGNATRREHTGKFDKDNRKPSTQ